MNTETDSNVTLKDFTERLEKAQRLYSYLRSSRARTDDTFMAVLPLGGDGSENLYSQRHPQLATML